MDVNIPATGSPPPVVAPPVPPGPAAEPLNPWFAIWVTPRATMRQILDSDPRHLVHLLAAAGGAVGWFQLNVPPQLLELTSTSLVLGLKLALASVGAILGLIFLYVFGFLVRLTGGWLEGRGDFIAVRSAVAWSNVPTIWSVLLWLPLIAFRGIEGFNFDPGALIHEPGGLLLLFPLMLVTIFVGVWQIVIFLKCVGEAHGFSAWHALATAILSLMIVAAVLAVPVVVVVMLILGMIAR